MDMVTWVSGYHFGWREKDTRHRDRPFPTPQGTAERQHGPTKATASKVGVVEPGVDLELLHATESPNYSLQSSMMRLNALEIQQDTGHRVLTQCTSRL